MCVPRPEKRDNSPKKLKICQKWILPRADIDIDIDNIHYHSLQYNFLKTNTSTMPHDSDVQWVKTDHMMGTLVVDYDVQTDPGHILFLRIYILSYITAKKVI
jgi:hypothetical protein